MKNRLPVLLVALGLVLLFGWACREATTETASQRVFRYEPAGVMGTVCTLALVADRDQAVAAQRQFESVEAELRRLEALLSTWIESSQISRFNAADAGQPLFLDQEVMTVLRLGHELHSSTAGTFDITARPLIELWRRAGQEGLLPSEDELTAARAESTWDHIHLAAGEVRKDHSSTRVDVDGIAKGHAIDRALEVLRDSGARGGMVEIGGDLRLFGQGPEGQTWKVAIRSPFADTSWAEIELQQGAVCSSGDYARSVEIDGQRYSHIIDPRSGWPTEETPAVTVVGPDAATADAWATALSILGDAGLDLLHDEDGLEALVVTGTPDDYRVEVTPGFRKLLVRADFDLANSPRGQI